MVKNYKISCNYTDMQIETIHRFISKSYWAQGIPLSTLQRAIENSLCFGIFADTGEQVGFARMVTDRATYAYLADVFIAEGHRGQGLSKWLMQTIVDHPELQGLRRICLATRDAHELYKQFGFKALAAPDIFMEKWQPDIYQQEP